MKIEDEIKLAATSDEEKYDKSVKTLFLTPRIIAPIIQMAMKEFNDVPIEDIIKSISDLSGDDGIDDVSAKAAQAVALNPEQSSVSDKLITYDVHFKLRNPALSTDEVTVYLYVDIEVQNESYESSLGYPLIKRALYYVARELSGQLGVLTEDTDYGKLQKSYSIWICDGGPVDQRNTMARFHITKDDLIGSSGDCEADYDLMEVIMIRRGDNDVTDGILDYLAGLFSHDIDRMDRYSNIKGDTDAVEEVKNMGGFGKALADRVRAEARSEALDEGRAEGRKEGRKEGQEEERKSILETIIKNLMSKDKELTREKATEQAQALITAAE